MNYITEAERIRDSLPESDKAGRTTMDALLARMTDYACQCEACDALAMYDDSDSVPLCQKCWDDCVAEAERAEQST